MWRFTNVSLKAFLGMFFDLEATASKNFLKTPLKCPGNIFLALENRVVKKCLSFDIFEYLYLLGASLKSSDYYWPEPVGGL